MANCCAITYIVFSGIATILGIVACTVPLFTVVDNDNYSTSMARHAHVVPGAVNALSAHRLANGTSPARRTAKVQSATAVKCPLFSGYCSGYALPSNTISTSDFLNYYGCESGLSGARSLCVIFIIGTALAVLSQMFAVSNAGNVRRAKICSSAAGGAGWVAGAVGANFQLNIGKCLRDDGNFSFALNGDYMIMVSAIVALVGCAIHFFSTIGMVSSWWCRCCGDQPGAQQSVYYQVPGQQGAAAFYQQQQTPMMQQQYPQQQPIVGCVVASDQPAYGPPAGYSQQGQPAYGYPPQNPGYPPQNPGYPPQNTGYPPQNPGYPPQNPGGYPQQVPAGYQQYPQPPPPQQRYSTS